MAGPWYIVVGGSEIDIDLTYGTKTTGMFGTGMPPLTHNRSEQALRPGALFQGLKVQPRVLQLNIQCWGATLAAFHSIRKLLLNAVKPNYGGTLAPVEIRYGGAVAGTKLAIRGYYDGGLEGNREAGGLTSENIALRFICYDPFWYAASATTVALDGNATVANADHVLRRISGVWSNISTDFSDTVYAIGKDLAGNIYIGGLFTDVGDANGDRIVKWTPGTAALSSLSTGIDSGSVLAIAPAADGGMFFAGDFTDLIDAAWDRIVKWTGSAFEGLAASIDSAAVYALATGLDGTLYAGGTFTNLIDANGDYISSFNGTAWVSLSTGMNGLVNALAVGPDGALYATGEFTTAGGVTCNGIAKWDGTAWSALGSGISVSPGAVYGKALAVGPDGTLYLGGAFASVSGIAANNIAKWDGTTWTPLGSGLGSAPTNFCGALAVGSDNLLYAGGYFFVAGGIACDPIAVWNGTSWSRLPVLLPPTTTAVRAISAVGADIYVGYDAAGTAYSSEETSVTNGGSAVAYPVITIKRVGGTTARVEYLKNQTTGQTLYLNYALLDGETLTITLTPGAKDITSDFFGNVIGRALLPNSDFAEWCLQPGANVVSLYVYEAGSPTVTASCVFTAAHWAVDGVAA